MLSIPRKKKKFPQPGSSLISQKILVGATERSHSVRYFFHCCNIAVTNRSGGGYVLALRHCIPRVMSLHSLMWNCASGAACLTHLIFSLFIFILFFNKLENGEIYTYCILFFFFLILSREMWKLGSKIKFKICELSVRVVTGCWNKRPNIMFCLSARLCPCFEFVTSQMFIIECDVRCRVWGGPHGNSVCFGLMGMYYTHDTIIGW